MVQDHKIRHATFTDEIGDFRPMLFYKGLSPTTATSYRTALAAIHSDIGGKYNHRNVQFKECSTIDHQPGPWFIAGFSFSTVLKILTKPRDKATIFEQTSFLLMEDYGRRC